MRRNTGSSVGRSLICPPSGVLPQVQTVRAASTFGNVVHEFCRRCNVDGRDAALDAIEDESYRAACEAIDLDRMPTLLRDRYVSELALAFDVKDGTARVLGQNVGRRYAELGVDHARQVPMSIDLAGFTEDSEGFETIDYKTGTGRYMAEVYRAQLAMGALAGTRAYGKTWARGVLLYVHSDGGVHAEYAVFDAYDLALFEAELRRLWARQDRVESELAAGQPLSDLVVGEHCEYCNAFRSCPAQANIIRWALEPSVLSDLGAAVESLTHERAAEAYQKMKVLRRVLDVVESALEAYATATPIDAGGGLVYGSVPWSKEPLVGSVARQVLVEKCGQKIADGAAEWKVTKEAVKSAGRLRAEALTAASGKRVTHKSVIDELLAEIKARGGVKPTFGSTVQEYRPKPIEAEAIKLAQQAEVVA